MKEKIRKYIEINGLLKRGKPVLIALSGGADSVALLHMLIALGYDCSAAHCNFKLRGAESDRDENFVKNLCEKFHIPLYINTFDTKKYAKENGISIEMAARDLRHKWFNELVEKFNFQAVAVAHHKDDNIETMLLNLFRGTGLKGLCGISIRNGKVVRPLLNVTKLDILNYIKQNNLDYVTDSTNFQLNIKRNIIRNEIIPALKDINPSIESTLYESGERFGGIYKVYKNNIQNIKNEIVTNKNDLIEINIEKLRQQADIKTVLYEILSDYGFNSAQTSQLADCFNTESGKQFFSPEFTLTKDRNFILIQKTGNINEHKNEYLINSDCNKITNPINLYFEKILFSSNFKITKEKNIAQLDFDKLRFPLRLRKWHEGDFFYPFGMKAAKKLSDFFVNNKFSIPQKEQTWLLISDNQIVWVVGERIDNRFRISENTKTVLQITVSKKQ